MKKTYFTFLRKRLFLLLALVIIIYPMENASAQDAVQLKGYVAAKTVDCLNPANLQHGPQFYLVDDATGQRVRIKGKDMLLKTVQPRQKIRIRGLRHAKPAEKEPGLQNAKLSEQTAGSLEEGIEIQEIELLPMVEEDSALAEPEPPVAHGANSLTMLSTLLVFISTDTNTCMTSETNARNRLFNNATNANLGMQAITKGRYGLQLGNGTGVPDDHTIDLLLNVNSPDHSTDSIEALALIKLFNSVAFGGMGLNRLDWNRILLFAPGGITNSGFTAYAYYPWGSYTTSGLVSMYGSSYGNNRMNGYLHELGHNFGFAHSSKGGSEYGDRTCVMGSSNDGTKTETYNAAKLLEKDWLNVFPNAKLAVTTDTTVDLYPLSSDPNVVNERIAVSFPGTDYYAAYHRDQQPYGYLSQGGDKNKLFVYTHASGNFQKSFQVANIAVGASYTGPGVVYFERYGPNNEYATVSFDMNDGNAKPVASTQSVILAVNSPIGITLSGSDGDSDPLTYSVVSSPSNGALTGSAPNLTYTPSGGYIGPDSFVFKVHDGKISSFATVSITVNTPPVASNQSINVFLNTPEPITLSATDANGQSLTYSIVGSPGKGSLSGTPPNLTYTPNNGLSGSDSFTFNANDGFADSSTATVSITIATSPNNAPAVSINSPNQSLYLQATTTVPGLYYGTVSGNIDTTTTNPNSQVLVNVGSKTEDSIAGNTTEIYTGSIFDADGQISFTEYIDDKARIWIDGNLVINNDAVNTRTSTTNLNLTPGWHTIEIRISNGSGGSGPVGGQIGIGCDTNGGTTWQTLVDPGDGSFLRINQVSSSALLTLDGTVTDTEQTPTASWSIVSGAASAVSFVNASAIDTTATFTETGTYVLRLTGNDGYVESTADITIIVNPPLPTHYAAWSGGSFANPLNSIGMDDNPDGDNRSNLLEFAFGTDPTLQDSEPLASDASAHGDPIPKPDVGGDFELYFLRRVDHGTSGSVKYTVQFSSNLVAFVDDTQPITFVEESSVNSEYELVKVPYPANSKFGRIRVEVAP